MANPFYTRKFKLKATPRPDRFVSYYLFGPPDAVEELAQAYPKLVRGMVYTPQIIAYFKPVMPFIVDLCPFWASVYWEEELRALVDICRQYSDLCEYMLLPSVPESALRTAELVDVYYGYSDDKRALLGCRRGIGSQPINWAIFAGIYLFPEVWQDTDIGAGLVRGAAMMNKVSICANVLDPEAYLQLAALGATYFEASAYDILESNVFDRIMSYMSNEPQLAMEAKLSPRSFQHIDWQYWQERAYPADQYLMPFMARYPENAGQAFIKT